jgi:predicted ArsR family transcriptional regulator
VSIPERHYDLAGELLAGALTEADASGERPAAVLSRTAQARGRELAQHAAGRAGVLQVLEDSGFEPGEEGEAITLRNCPFHVLARRHTQLICGMNERLLEGVLDAVPDAGLVARLQPTEGRCCVRLEPPASPA